jgi:hypothetical protein
VHCILNIILHNNVYGGSSYCFPLLRALWKWTCGELWAHAAVVSFFGNHGVIRIPEEWRIVAQPSRCNQYLRVVLPDGRAVCETVSELSAREGSEHEAGGTQKYSASANI